MNNDRRDMHQRELQEGHVHAFGVDVRRRNVELPLIVDTGVFQGQCQSDHQRRGPARGLRRTDKTAGLQLVFEITAVSNLHLCHELTNVPGRKVLAGPLVVELQLVIRLAQDVAGVLFERHDQMREHLGEQVEVLAPVLLDDLQVALFALVPPRAEIGRVAQGDRRHFDEVAEDLPGAVAVSQRDDELDDLFLGVGGRGRFRGALRFCGFLRPALSGRRDKNL